MKTGNKKSRVTLYDVAALAGVSHQTVSRVINNSDRVRPTTREKVETAVKELGYYPNVIARSMVWGKTQTIGCITPSLTNYIFSRIIESAQVEAHRLGFFVLTGSAPTVNEVQPLLDELLNRQIDGLMVLNPRDDLRYKLLEPLAENNIPIVYLKNTPVDELVSSVSCDDQEGGYLATKYLIDLGHTSIATILGPKNEECTTDRLVGYKKALEEAGITPRDEIQIEGNWSAQSGIDALEYLFSNKRYFSAIFAQNDQMAVGVIRKLRESGYRVPEDISVIGYDNIPLASFFDPPLTSIHQPLDKFGERAAQIVIEIIKNPSAENSHVRLRPTLVERETCKAFRK